MPCGTISQGETGPAQGIWLLKDAQVKQLTHGGATWNESMPAGQYQSQIVFQPGSDTWHDPLSRPLGCAS